MRRATIAQAAVVVQVATLIAVGLVLIVAALTAPAAVAAEPTSVRLRPATEQEQREWTEEQLYERLRRQQEAGR